MNLVCAAFALVIAVNWDAIRADGSWLDAATSSYVLDRIPFLFPAFACVLLVLQLSEKPAKNLFAFLIFLCVALQQAGLLRALFN